MQTHEELLTLVMREMNDVVYIADTETHELLFLNDRGVELIGCRSQEEWRGKPCHKILQNLEEPCPFCTNSRLDQKEFYCWEHYNAMLNRYFYMKDKLVEWDGRLVRLEIAVDNTEREKIYRQLEQKLVTEQTLVASIKTLSMNKDLTAAINSLLEIIGEYYKGERAYIFECNYEQQLLCNTYEWCLEGIEPQLQNLLSLPLGAADRWLEEFRKKGEFHISNLGENVDKNSAEYQILEPQGVQSLMAAPLMEDDEIIGFIGVDNPSANLEQMVLLRSIAFFVLDDIKKKKMTSQLLKLSYKDTLTGVWNRNKYKEKLYALEKSTPDKLGIVYADINELKRANDMHGHQYGDRMITRAADILESLFPSDVYRIGGDEFVILCADISHDEFYERADRLYSILSGEEECSLAIGLKWMENQDTVMKQISAADQLMYAEKQRYYSSRHYGKSSFKNALTRRLTHEIEEGKFKVYLQPQIELNTGELHGAEALVRRTNSKGELEAPVRFIPRYETEGIIRHVDFFVLERVCQLLADWRESGSAATRVAVNLSRFTLLEHGITESLRGICEKYGIPPAQIVIEVTESMGQMEKVELMYLMVSLREAGFSVSLDDFGAEYSNLAILVSLHFDEVKLDKSLIDNIVNKKQAQIVATHAIELCKELDITTSVAEGIETGEQLELLKNFQCDVGQGYFFDYPLSEKQFEEKYIKGACS